MVAHALGALLIVACAALGVRAILRRSAQLEIVVPVLTGLALRLAVVLFAHIASIGAGEGGILFLDDKGYLQTGRDLAASWSAGDLVNPASPDAFGSLMFGYPALVGLVFTLVGPSVLTVKLIQVLLGTATILFVALLAERVIGPRSARTAAWFAALMPTLVWWPAPMLKETLVAFLATGCLVAVTRLPSRAAAWTFLAAWFALFLTRSTVAVAIALALLTVGAITAFRHRDEVRWNALGRLALAALGLSVLGVVLVTRGQPLSLITEYSHTFQRMVDLYQGSRIADVPADVLKSLVSPLPWAFDDATRNWDRGLYPGTWALYVLYPAALLGLWRLRTKPEVQMLALVVGLVLLMNAASSGYVFRQRSLIEPIVVLLAVAGMRSWRHLALTAAAAIGAASAVAAVNTRSVATTAVVALAAGSLLLLSRRLPSESVAEPVASESPLLRFLRDPPDPTLAGARAGAGRWKAAWAGFTRRAPAPQRMSTGLLERAAAALRRMRDLAPSPAPAGWSERRRAARADQESAS